MVPSKTRMTQGDLSLVTVLWGFFSAVAQVLLIRELLTVFRGNELIIGIIFSAWFAGIYLGSRYNLRAEKAVLERRVLGSLLLFPVLLCLSVYLALFIPVIVPRIMGTFYSLGFEFLLTLLFTTPVSLLNGFSFPPLVSLVSEGRAGLAGGRVFTLESAGSFAGGLAFSFLFVDLLNPLGMISLMAAASILTCVYARKRFHYLSAIIFPLVLFIFAGTIEEGFMSFLWKRTHTGILAEYRRTKYQTVFIEKVEREVNVYGNGVFYGSVRDPYETRLLLHLIRGLGAGDGGEILVMGGGAGSLLEGLLDTHVRRVDYLETDPALWEMVERYRRLPKAHGGTGDRLRIILEDPRSYLSGTSARYDMILSFPPPPENAMLNRFYTREFFSLCRGVLRPDGVMLASMQGFSDIMGADLQRYLASVYKGFIAEFPFHLNSSGETLYLMGGLLAGSLPSTTDELLSGYAKRFSRYASFKGDTAPGLKVRAEELNMLFEKTRMEYFDARIIPLLPSVEENRDGRPKAYWNHILMSALQEKSPFYYLLENLYLSGLMILILASIILCDLRRKNSARRFAGGMIIFATGFTSMCSMVLLIILYQNLYGVIYYRISLINALFMAGLASGSFLANRLAAGFLRLRLFLLFLAIGLILILDETGYEPLFWGIIFVLSFLCGTVFSSLFLGLSEDDYHLTASLLYSMDNFGAIIGSFATALVLIPLFGIRGTFLCAMGVTFLALASSFYFRYSAGIKASR